MDHKKSISLKKEETIKTSDEVGYKAQVYPSRVEVKEDSDEGVKEEFLEHPLDESWCTECSNGCPGLTLGWDETENNNSLSALLNAIHEAETECCPPPFVVPKEKLESMECEVQINMIPVTVVLVPFIPKEEPGADSTRYEFDSARFICVGESCGICEGIVHQGVLHSEQSIVAEMSTLLTVCGNRRQELTVQQGSSLCLRRNCSFGENEFQEFCCNFCQQCFPSKYRLIMHVFTHIDGVQPPVYVCKSCGEVFPSRGSLNRHLTSIGDKAISVSLNEKFDCSDKHENFINLKSDQKILDTEKINKESASQEIQKTSDKSHTKNGPHKCDICGKFVTSKKQLNRHVLIHTGKKPYKCEICGKSFIRSCQLKRHSVVHIKEKPYKCEICGKCFPLLKYLQNHELVHSGKRPYKCDICGRSYLRLNCLRSHLVLHSGNRRHKCDICGLSYFRAEHLRKHALKHSEVRQYKCDICQKSFSQSADLTRHSAIHTGERPHRCNTCGKSFSQLGNLKSHSVVHSGNKSHKCEICGKAFFFRSGLKKHSVTHTGHKPHKCDVCGKSFYQLYAFNRHALIHTRIYSHKCDTCGKSFAHWSQLARHELKHS